MHQPAAVSKLAYGGPPPEVPHQGVNTGRKPDGFNDAKGAFSSKGGCLQLIAFFGVVVGIIIGIQYL